MITAVEERRWASTLDEFNAVINEVRQANPELASQPQPDDSSRPLASSFLSQLGTSKFGGSTGKGRADYSFVGWSSRTNMSTSSPSNSIAMTVA